jgi:hypothetical protein
VDGAVDRNYIFASASEEFFAQEIHSFETSVDVTT